jgi:S1-C subfamily serine protease
MRKNTDPRSNYGHPFLMLSMAVCIVSSTASFAGEGDEIGKPVPSGTQPSSIPAEISIPTPPQWQSLTFGFPGKRIAEILSKPVSGSRSVTTRGAREINVYKKAAPSVVLVTTDERTSGSGSYIGSNQFITNWHVVNGAQKVGIVFNNGTAVPATVRKVDQERDLALLEAEFVPEAASPIKLGSNAQIQVGTDVHAIGHPFDQRWTYTKGFVSQIRPDYEWTYGDDANEINHRATVIQHQIPISPGNSGGPVLNDDGIILGMNTYGSSLPLAQALNFAVSVDDIRTFLDSPGQTLSARVADRLCVEKKLFEGRNTEDTGFLRGHDTNCDEKADLWFFVPDDTSEPMEGWRDTNSDGRIDVVIIDLSRDGKWDFSFYDTNYDGRTELTGHHPDGKIEPEWFETYTGT